VLREKVASLEAAAEAFGEEAASPQLIEQRPEKIVLMQIMFWAGA
jgi:hypothetical protein